MITDSHRQLTIVKTHLVKKTIHTYISVLSILCGPNTLSEILRHSVGDLNLSHLMLNKEDPGSDRDTETR